jgi:CheY-like chemotaxis protein
MKRELTILVIDDDDGHTELVRRNLERSGVHNPIVALNSGRLALDFVFRRGAYANRAGNGELLVLLDINMPGIDGVEVLRQIKADPSTKSIPVIMLTTTDDPREINRCYAMGCSVYITKPVESAAFIEAIKRLGLFISVVSPPVDLTRLT